MPRKGKKEPGKPLKVNLGSGRNRMDGYLNVDCIDFPEVDLVADLTKRWPWDDGSVEEAQASHFVEHLDPGERTHFVNELWRVLGKGCKATLICPYWASCRAYGDPTHKWPPVGEFWFYYLNREWRLGDEAKKIPPNAPHTDAKHVKGGFTCDFEATWGYNLHPQVQLRSGEAQAFQVQFYKEAASDIIATLTARK